MKKEIEVDIFSYAFAISQGLQCFSLTGLLFQPLKCLLTLYSLPYVIHTDKNFKNAVLVISKVLR